MPKEIIKEVSFKNLKELEQKNTYISQSKFNNDGLNSIINSENLDKSISNIQYNNYNFKLNIYS